MQRINVVLELLRKEPSQHINMTALQLDHTAATTLSTVNLGDHAIGVSPPSPLFPGTQLYYLLLRLSFVLSENFNSANITTVCLISNWYF